MENDILNFIIYILKQDDYFKDEEFYISTIPPKIDSLITLYNTGGSVKMETLHTKLYSKNFQIRIRNVEKEETYKKAGKIKEILLENDFSSTKTSFGIIREIKMITNVMDLGQDVLNRWEVSLNFAIFYTSKEENEEIQELYIEIEKLKEEKNVLLKEKSQLEKDILNKNKEIDLLEAEKESLTTDLETKQNIINNLEKDKKVLTLEIENKNTKIQELMQNIENLEIEISNKDTKVQQLEKDILSKNEEIDLLEAEKENLNIEIQNNNIKIQQLEEQLEEIKQINNDFYSFVPTENAITGYSKNLILPDFIVKDGTEYPVFYVDGFSEMGLVSVKLPQNLLEIGKDAFYRNNLKTIDIPDSVKIIGFKAFDSNNLINLDLSNTNVISIRGYAFKNNSLEKVKLPNTLKEISSNAFDNNKLTEIVIPKNVVKIDNFAFKNNPLEKITIPENIELGRYVFPQNFIDCYNQNNKQAGTYIKEEDGTWNKIE